MKTTYNILALTFALLASTAYAADLYDQYPTPNAIKCDAIVKGLCTDASRPDKIVVQYRDRETGALSMQEETTYELVYCRPRKDKCFDDADTYRGKSVQTKDSRYVVFKDFYVYPGADGTVWAYRNGTGPLFGGASAKTSVVAPTTVSVKATPLADGSYDVWCNPVGDACNITIDGGSDSVGRDRLPVYMPIAKDTSNCNLEFCYNSKEDVIGLNPGYELWKK